MVALFVIKTCSIGLVGRAHSLGTFVLQVPESTQRVTRVEPTRLAHS